MDVFSGESNRLVHFVIWPTRRPFPIQCQHTFLLFSRQPDHLLFSHCSAIFLNLPLTLLLRLGIAILNNPTQLTLKGSLQSNTHLSHSLAVLLPIKRRRCLLETTILAEPTTSIIDNLSIKQKPYRFSHRQLQRPSSILAIVTIANQRYLKYQRRSHNYQRAR